MKNLFAVIAAFAALLSVSSCNLINPEEQAPSYLELKTFSLSTNYATQGTASHKIKDAWVYVDGELIGVYELPAKFPVLKEGAHRLAIGPGILDNGIASTRVVYPFYKYYEADINLIKEQTLTIDTLPVTYFPGRSYTWFEDFEGSGYSLDTLSSSQAAIAIDTQEPFEGSKCMLLHVNDTAAVLDCASINAYNITVGADCYLELNYKCDQPFVLGIIANYPGGGTSTAGVISFNPSTAWNKTYVNLKKTIGNFSTATNYNIYFRMVYEGSNGSGNAWIDNIKLVTL